IPRQPHPVGTNVPTTRSDMTMTAEQKEKQPAASAKQESRRREVAIGDRVLDALGRPPLLHRVQVRGLSGDCYRVNVFVGPDAGSAKLAHSYFVKADGDGNITASSPEITRQY